jgi:hypothetical protein
MFFRILFTASLLVGILPLVSHAQTAPRFYVGAGANLLTNTPFTSAGVPRLVGPSVTVGRQLSTKLALQVSASYFRQNESNSYSYSTTYFGQPTIATSSYSLDSKLFIMPVLLRYTFTAAPKRFYVDGLGGVTVAYSHGHSASTVNYVGTPYSSEDNYSQVKANLTLGPAVRYAISPNIELTANGLVSAILNAGRYQFSDRLFLNVLVGAHYTFG